MPIDRAIKATRRQWVLLAVLLAALAGLLVFRGGAQTNAPATESYPVARRSPAGKAGGAVSPGDLNVRLDELTAARQEPQESERNPFRFRERRPEAPKAETGPGAGAPTAPIQPAVPPGLAPPPPIPLKFIGIVESPEAGRVAALSDGRNVFHGREGDIIEGRYRIVRIGVESIVLEHADGRGRQTIRLSGS